MTKKATHPAKTKASDTPAEADELPAEVAAQQTEAAAPAEREFTQVPPVPLDEVLPLVIGAEGPSDPADETEQAEAEPAGDGQEARALFPAGTPATDDDRDKGLYRKYKIDRTDNQDQPGQRHADCDYFLIDEAHDPFAEAAFAAYGKAAGIDPVELRQLVQGGDYERAFYIQREDRQSLPGRKHENCHYLVLDLMHDPHADAALLAYAQACEATHPMLARDLFTLCQAPTEA